MYNYRTLSDIKDLREYRLPRYTIYTPPRRVSTDYLTRNNPSAIGFNDFPDPITMLSPPPDDSTDYLTRNNPSAMGYNDFPDPLTMLSPPPNDSLLSNYSEALQPVSFSAAGVKFREIPFYDPLHVLLTDYAPNPFSLSLVQESSFSFSLSPKEVRDIVCNHECKILLRFCKLIIGIEQEDSFPPNLTVKVNGEPIQLEETLWNKPIDITQFTKISSTVNNVVQVSWPLEVAQLKWMDCDLYAITLYIAKPISSSSLLLKLRDRAVKKSHLTTAMVVEKIKNDQDLEIATTSIQVSLLCPLGKLKMKYPCRASTCTHIACFDASLYIELNQKKWKWQCPICDQQAFYKDLEIDELFMDIISMVPHECTDVQFFENGLWAPIMPVLTSTAEISESVEMIDISSDTED